MAAQDNQLSDDSVDAHYKNIMCLKPTRFGPKPRCKSEYLNEVYCEPGRENLKYLCVLPRGHEGKCCDKYNTLFRSSDVTKKICSKMELSIKTTPGNDDYVYKNRDSRLYPYAISSLEEKKIRDKKIKKKCAIPKKDMSTPEYIAQAYLDWMVYILSIEGIKELLVQNEFTKTYIQYFDDHKKFLIDHFRKYNRRLFNDEGNTICCVTKYVFTIKDLADIERDNRVDIKETDWQMGHNTARDDDIITVRGCNVLPQTRRGNLIIGTHKFTEDDWINELKNIVSQC